MKTGGFQATSRSVKKFGMRHIRKMAYCLAALLWLAAFPLYSQGYPKIITLSPSLTKSLLSLGISNRLIGCTTYCILPDTCKIPTVATAITVNIEKVFSLQPDLVLATSLTMPETIQKLRQLGLHVEVFNTPKSYEEICEQFIEVGRVTGKEKEARSIIDLEKQKVSSILERVPKGNSKPTIFFQIGANPIFSVLSGTFMDDFITMAGGKNIASDFKHGTASRESILIRNPDIIIVTTMGIFGEQERKEWGKYPELNAARNHKILVVDADKACSPSPDHFREILKEIIDFIY